MFVKGEINEIQVLNEEIDHKLPPMGSMFHEEIDHKLPPMGSVFHEEVELPHMGSYVNWNKDYKPGPYPVTQKERDAAAKKYGLLPAEYEPYPDDGLGYGDYPKLPAISGDDKDPYYPWDFPEHKRNFNEPIHVHADMYGEDRYNVSFKPRFSLLYMWTCFLSVVGGFFAIYFFMEDKKMFRPVHCCHLRLHVVISVLKDASSGTIGSRHPHKLTCESLVVERGGDARGGCAEGQVALLVSHSILMSSDGMKPRSGEWTVIIDFLQEAAITSLSSDTSGKPLLKN
uniref:Uncharacterized protein n=1 Tax=Timema poppense TaxID=170557 RepID=A0A7R9GYK9_TIMPO|nr:unnamed protein product [Timema poppensis]